MNPAAYIRQLSYGEIRFDFHMFAGAGTVLDSLSKGQS